MIPCIMAAQPLAEATPVHPMFVHFPIALLMAVLVLDLLVILGKRERMAPCSGAVLIMATLGAAAAVATGLMAEDATESMSPDEARDETVEWHETCALTTLGLAVILAVWRAILRLDLPLGHLRWLYIAVLLAACAMVGVTGHLGGKLVYTYHVGLQ